MSLRTVGLIIAIAGIIIALVFALADVIGLGGLPDRFGWRQTVGTGFGIAAFIAGGFVYMTNRSKWEE
jgi:hypothetical protein